MATMNIVCTPSDANITEKNILATISNGSSLNSIPEHDDFLCIQGNVTTCLRKDGMFNHYLLLIHR